MSDAGGVNSYKAYRYIKKQKQQGKNKNKTKNPEGDVCFLFCLCVCFLHFYMYISPFLMLVVQGIEAVGNICIFEQTEKTANIKDVPLP